MLAESRSPVPGLAGPLIPVSLFLLLLFGFCASPVEARCGFPELPHQAQPFDQQDSLLEWEFFEEGRLMKVGCQNGLVGWNLNGGFSELPTAPLSSSANGSHHLHSLLKIDTAVWIQCWNSQWNNTGLHCLERVDLLGSKIEVTPASSLDKKADNLIEPPTITTNNSIHSLIDKNATTCVDIDDNYFDQHSIDHKIQKIVYSIRLPSSAVNGSEGSNVRRIPRLVLMIRRHIDQWPVTSNGSFRANLTNTASSSGGGGNQTNLVASLEQLILRMNHRANMSDNQPGPTPPGHQGDQQTEPDEGNVEVEEAKRFLDFVYLTDYSHLKRPGKNGDENKEDVVAEEGEEEAGVSGEDRDKNQEMLVLLSDSANSANSANSAIDNWRDSSDRNPTEFDSQLIGMSKLIETGRYETRIVMKVATDDDSGIENRRTCILSEDAAVLHPVTGDKDGPKPTTTKVANETNEISTEYLVFNCPLTGNHTKDSNNIVLIELYFRARHPAGATGVATKNIGSSFSQKFQLCGVETIAVTDSECGRPYVPIYGVVSEKWSSSSSSSETENNKPGKAEMMEYPARHEAIYTCAAGYLAINLTKEMESELAPLSALRPKKKTSLALGSDDALSKTVSLKRVCDRETRQWQPPIEDIHCVPRAVCRRSPPLLDGKKFYFEYSRLDHLNRAIVGVSMATLRCQQLTDYVSPFVMYSCDRNGEWIRLGTALMDNHTIQSDPICKPAVYPIRPVTTGNVPRRPGSKSSHYYHHYYHHYYNRNQLINSVQTNRTSMLLFGRKLNDNKNLIYYGVAGLVVLFGGSFIILFHVRRMAKKISNQMRARSYLSTGEKIGYGGYNSAGSGAEEGFMAMAGGGMDGNLPPYYNSESNYYDANTMFSDDLPPPTTPISMPSNMAAHHQSTGGGGTKSNNLSSNFDAIKF